jgi:hypothetical protein
MIKYDVVCKDGHKQARMYGDSHLSLAILHAKSVKGRVIDRLTGKVIWNYEDKNDKL